MSKTRRVPQGHSRRADTPMELSHLRREARTALELAVVAFAPSELVDRLAMVAGIIEAIAGFPPDSAPALALVPATAARARSALDDWREWEKTHLAKG